MGYPNGPDTWEDLRIGGKKIKDQFGNPVGVGLSQELDTNMAMRALLWSFGGSDQDANGNVAIYSKETIEAIKYMRSLYKETETAEVFTWDPSSNNRGILAGRLSFVCNAISVTRSAEKDNPDMSARILVSPALEGAGPPDRRRARDGLLRGLGLRGEQGRAPSSSSSTTSTTSGRPSRRASSTTSPASPRTVPDLAQQLSNDPEGQSPRQVQGSRPTSSTGPPTSGYPGYATAGHRRGLQHLRDPDDVRQGGPGRAVARGARPALPKRRSSGSSTSGSDAGMAIVQTRALTKVFRPGQVGAVVGVDLESRGRASSSCSSAPRARARRRCCG